MKLPKSPKTVHVTVSGHKLAVHHLVALRALVDAQPLALAPGRKVGGGTLAALVQFGLARRGRQCGRVVFEVNNEGLAEADRASGARIPGIG